MNSTEQLETKEAQEPYGWLVDGKFTTLDYYAGQAGLQGHDVLELYTHQLRRLSSDEIEDIRMRKDMWGEESISFGVEFKAAAFANAIQDACNIPRSNK